jgi:hypothetical protein
VNRWGTWIPLGIAMSLLAIIIHWFVLLALQTRQSAQAQS